MTKRPYHFFEPRRSGVISDIFRYWECLRYSLTEMKAAMDRQCQTGGIEVDPPLPPGWQPRRALSEYSIQIEDGDECGDWVPAVTYRYRILRWDSELYGPEKVVPVAIEPPFFEEPPVVVTPPNLEEKPVVAAPLSFDEQMIQLLAEYLRQHHHEQGSVEPKPVYLKLMQRAFSGLRETKFDEVIWPGALKQPGVPEVKAGRKPRRK